MNSPPDLVKGTYTTDLNINKIHEAIISRYNFFHESIPRIELKIKNLKVSLNNATKTINEIRSINEEISSLSEKIKDYENNISLNEYLNRSRELLQSYNKVASNKSKGVVIFIKNKEVEDPKIISQRLKIIEKYLEIAKHYITLEIIHKTDNKVTCPGCDIDLSNIFIDEESGLCVCPNCGYERESITHNSGYKDSQRFNNNTRNNYDDCENFRKALLRFQGKQLHKPPEKLYTQLDEYFTKLNKPNRKDILKLSPLPNGQKRGTSRTMMFEALNETNNSAYYDDINLILHNYWGWSLPDISHIEEQIMEDYMFTQQVYNNIPNKDREASLNIQFRLFVHLKAVDYPCSKDDFKIQTSRDSLIFHNEMWKIMCEKTGIKFFSVI